MAPILAVASLTLRESVRRRAFLVMAFFAVFLLASSAFFPALEPAGQVRLIESWGLRATLLFGILLVVFLASLSLPQDIEEKKVFMLITKPLSRPGLYLGKWLGFAALLAIFIVCMGGLTLGYTRFVAWKGGAEAAKALEVRDRILAPQVEICRGPMTPPEATFAAETPPLLWVKGPGQDFIAWHFKGLTFTGWPKGCIGRTLRVRIRVHLTPGTGPLKLWTVAYTRLKNPLRLQDAAHESDVDDGGWITLDLDPRNFLPDDGDMRVAVLQRPGSPRAIGGGPLDASALLINHYPGEIDETEYTYTSFSTIVGTGYKDQRAATELEALYNVKTQKHTVTINQSPPLLARWVFEDLDGAHFDRDASIEVRLPIKGPVFRKYGYITLTVRRGKRELHSQKLRVATNTPASIPFDPKWVQQGQPLVIEVDKREEPDTVLIVVPDGITLRSRNVLFESGFVRALGLTYLELLLLLAIVLPCSTKLSGPVSLFVGIALFICGMALTSIQENLVHLDSVIRMTEIIESTQGEMHSHGGVEVPLWALRASRFLLRNVVLAAFPELHRFEGDTLLVSGILIPGPQLGWTALYVGLYTLVSSIIGMLILWRREFH